MYSPAIDKESLVSYSISMRGPRDLAKYQRIVALRDEKSLTFREIGEKLGMTRQRAQQIYARAILRFPRRIRQRPDVSSHVTSAKGSSKGQLLAGK